jgi:hypothetical protein
MSHDGACNPAREEFIQYSVGRRHVYVWTEQEEDVWLALKELRLEDRAEVYRWRAERQPDGSIYVWDATRLQPSPDPSSDPDLAPVPDAKGRNGP